MKTIKTFIKRHAVLTYYALVFTISWGGILLLAGPGGIPGTKAQVERLFPFMLLVLFAGPSLGSILSTILVDGRSGLRELFSRLRRWQVGARWYIVALLFAPCLVAAVLLALSLRSPAFLPGILNTSDKASLVLFGIAWGLVGGGFLEEIGWTGFAVPRLRQRYGVLTTALIVGLLWGAWHFLVFWESNTFSTAFGLALLLARLFSWLPPYRVFMVWVYDQTGSLLLAMLIHATLVASLQILVPPALTGVALLTYIIVWASALWVVVAVIALTTRGQIARPQPYQDMRVASR